MMFTEQELEEIKNYIKNSSEISPVAVGCDASYSGDNTVFALTIGIHIDGKHGSKIFKNRFKINRRLGLREKLWKEVTSALELAIKIVTVVGKRPFEVHLDLNPKQQEASSIIVKEAKAMVEGYGFNVKVKPEAFLSTYCSDYYVRGKDLKEVIIEKI